MKPRKALVGLLLLIVIAWPLTLRPPARWRPSEFPERAREEFPHVCLQVIRDSSLYAEGWDTLSQTAFWRAAMHMGPDSLLVNLAANRRIVDTMLTVAWQARSPRQRKAYEDSLRNALGLDRSEEIYFTTGRNHFYRLEAVLSPIDLALTIFAEEGVDPWFAQAILMIESPGRLQFSTDGAYGAFQLMKGVARDMGLIVNDTLDQRADFESSARGAARLIRTVCLPKTRTILQEANLSWQESETWFRLLVLHVYHAGARNVSRVMKQMKPEEGGMPLIRNLWQSKSRRFGNASQNYSQIILAAFMEVDAMLDSSGIICPPELLPDHRQGRVDPDALRETDSLYGN